MTVAKSQVYSPDVPTKADENPTDSTISMWLEAISAALSARWQSAVPEIKLLAIAAWQRALSTPPKLLLLCAALCFMGSFGVMLLALFATALTLLLKLFAITFAGVALWQWIRTIASAVNRSLQPQRQIAAIKQSKN